MNNYCIDCKSKGIFKILSRKEYKKCRKCAGIYRRGRKKYYCIEKNCNKELKNIYAKRCNKCELKRRYRLGIMNNKGKNNGRYGKGNTIKGKNNPNWKGGLSFEEYGNKFNNKLKEQIRYRDQYKCKICNCSQLENGRKLDVHHIDYNKKNNNINNLIALCISCHMKTNYNRKYWKKYLKKIQLSMGRDFLLVN